MILLSFNFRIVLDEHNFITNMIPYNYDKKKSAKFECKILKYFWEILFSLECLPTEE